MAENIKKKFSREKPHVNIGGIGHVDHGKTTLIAAITKYLAAKGQAKFKDYGEIDKAPEEKSRGITISTSHVEFETSDRTDAKGTKMDGAILICSAQDGAMNQTKEHLLLAKQIGIKYIVVFINKVDVVLDLDQIQLVKDEIKDELKKLGYDAEKTPMIGGSALCALEGKNSEIGEKAIVELLEAVDKHIPTPERNVDAPFKMYIEDIFSIEKVGTVITGRVEQGTLKKGEEIEISGLGRPTKKTVATGLEMHNKELGEEGAQPGDGIGIKLRGVAKDEVERGQLVSKVSEAEKLKEKIKTCNKFSATAYISSKEERGRHTSFRSGYRPQFYFRTADVTGTISLKNKDEEVKPGNSVEFTVELIKPLAIEEKEKFIMREGGSTIGQGTVLEIIGVIMKSKIIAQAKKVFRDYRIIDKFIAGIVLTGNEIKSLRSHQVSINEAYILPQKGELYVISMPVAAYKYSNPKDLTKVYDPQRMKKILLKRREINKGLSEVRDCSGPAFAKIPNKGETYQLESSFESLLSLANNLSHYCGINFTTFRLDVKRSDKKFPKNSLTLQKELGEIIRKKYDLKVDLSDPQKTFYIRIYPQFILFFSEKIKGLGGLPVGSSGQVLVLLSGGIDSPVAAYQLMKRGLEVVYLHFYHQKEGQEKISALSEKLSPYNNFSKQVYLVNAQPLFTEISHISQEKYRLIILKRMFIRCACFLAEKLAITTLATGDSLAQVASQTLESLAVIQQASISAFEKLETLAQKITELNHNLEKETTNDKDKKNSFFRRLGQSLGLVKKPNPLSKLKRLIKSKCQELEKIVRKMREEKYKQINLLTPLISYDKKEIIAEAQKIGTYDLSLKSYDDCCSLFEPRYPVTKPRKEIVEKLEKEIFWSEVLEKIYIQRETKPEGIFPDLKLVIVSALSGEAEIEFTIKNLKYDEEKGILIGLGGGGRSLFLYEKDFESIEDEELAAKENGFDIDNDPGVETLISEEGKYKGFYIGNGEKYQTLVTLSSNLFSSVPTSFFFSAGSKNRYTRKNIDNFRELFPNNLDQNNPKYFLGFRPGDIEKIGTKFCSVFHQRDIKDQQGNFWEIEFGKELTRTYYELKSCYESKKIEEASEKQQIKEIIFSAIAFNEWSNKNKKEH
nr:12342_t:CDS:2 [Entrophospora candida]